MVAAAQTDPCATLWLKPLTPRRRMTPAGLWHGLEIGHDLLR